MISIADAVELKATIVTVGTNNFDIAISEIFIDSKWEKFTVVKPMNVLLADYDQTVPTATENAVAKEVLQKYLSTLSGDQLVAAKSLIAKL